MEASVTTRTCDNWNKDKQEQAVAPKQRKFKGEGFCFSKFGFSCIWKRCMSNIPVKTVKERKKNIRLRKLKLILWIHVCCVKFGNYQLGTTWIRWRKVLLFTIFSCVSHLEWNGGLDLFYGSFPAWIVHRSVKQTLQTRITHKSKWTSRPWRITLTNRWKNLIKRLDQVSRTDVSK